MKLLKTMLRNEAGYALTMSLILLVIGGLFVAPSAVLMTTSLKANHMVDEADLELYAADAGVEYALWRLQYDDELVLPTEGEESSLDFAETPNDRTVIVTISNEGEQGYKIASTAGGTTIESLVEIIESSIFGSAIVVNGGDLYIEDSYIDGDIWVSGSFTSSNSEVTGQVHEGETGDFTPLDPEPYRNEALAGTTLEGNQTISVDTTWDTAMYITGDLKIEAGVTLTLGGTVWVEGSVSPNMSLWVEGLEDNHTSIIGEGNLIAEFGDIWIEYLRLDTTNMPLVWAIDGDIHVETNQSIKAIIYAPEGNVEIEKTDVIYGAVFGQTVSLMENCSIDYPDDDPDSLFALGGVQILTYTIE